MKEIQLKKFLTMFCYKDSDNWPSLMLQIALRYGNLLNFISFGSVKKLVSHPVKAILIPNE